MRQELIKTIDFLRDTSPSYNISLNKKDPLGEDWEDRLYLNKFLLYPDFEHDLTENIFDLIFELKQEIGSKSIDNSYIENLIQELYRSKVENPVKLST